MTAHVTERSTGPTVVGSGALASAVAAALATDAPPVAATVVVDEHVLAGDWPDHPSRTGSVPQLPVRVEMDRAVVGPWEHAGVAGCVRCARTRHRRASDNPGERDLVAAEHADELGRLRSPLLTPLASDTIAWAVGHLAARLVEPVPDGGAREVLTVDLHDLTVQRRTLLPEPMCERCGGLPDDGPDRARIELTDVAKPSPDVLRSRDLVGELDDVLDLYVDPDVGLVRGVDRYHASGFMVAVAPIRCRTRDNVEPGSGTTRDFSTSRLVAVLEALERFGGVEPGGKRTVVRGSLAELGDRAVDPRRLGLHPEWCYELPGYPFRDVRDDRVCRWVWAHSFARDEAVLVPEAHVYYYTGGMHSTDDTFCFETSNGCAIGSSLEEAILYGLMEICERDAFLLTWYRELAPPEVSLDGGTDPDVVVQAESVRFHHPGYRIRVFDTTLDLGVPSVWALGERVVDDPALPAVVCSAGSNLVPSKAVFGALGELGTLLPTMARRYRDEADQARAMVEDRRLVRSMSDHALLYSDDRAASRLDFLLDPPRTVDVDDVGAGGVRASRGHSLTADLRAVVDRILAAGLDVLVVDQTTDEHRVAGLRCVKTIVPGALPMTFGHMYQRTRELPRLTGDTVAVPAGARRRGDDLNPHPHPFP